MDKWFTIDQIDEGTYIISEYRHWEETHCYLLNGSSRSLLIDTGLGICNIYDEVMKLTNKPVTAVATHIHWDHIGGHKYIPDFYAHAEELSWLNGEFHLTIETIRGLVADQNDLYRRFGTTTSTYEFFQGTPTKVLEDGENIELSGRKTWFAPGHFICLLSGQSDQTHTLFLLKDFGASGQNPEVFLRIIVWIFSRRFGTNEKCVEVQEDGKLHHLASKTFDYGDWAVWL